MSRRPVDELWDRQRRLDAERLRPERPLPPARGPMWELIELLDRLLSDPGPPDPKEET
ncbi:hypothetical protein ACFOY2_04995 [Nonomuraea purpurea]|uniref:MarR family transcriptional regulator n=1 Tax=Nonomuraea purpurea TaxID=1849276 RepID=A0ABV8G1X1_9ACTN